MSEENRNKRTIVNALIVIALAVAVVGAFVLKSGREETNEATAAPAIRAESNAAAAPTLSETPVVARQAVNAIPRLVDLGANKCIPCKMMAPILDELAESYHGKMEVEFIDVWENPAAGKEYNIRLIPTQIFLSPDGEELFRHEGFFSREQILAKWRELGYDLPETPAPQEAGKAKADE